MKLLFTFLFTGYITIAAGAADSVNINMKIKAERLSENIIIDGVLSESVWNSNNYISEFIQKDPVEGAMPTEKTEIRIAYDNEAIYIGARMYDSNPDSIIARLGRRDNWTSSDQFYFFVDPYFDRRTGYYFGINAAGTMFDGVLYNDDWDDNTWDGVWEAKSKIDEKGWTAEMKIPYSQIRFHKKDEYAWGVNFKRVIERKNESDYITFTPKNGSGFVSRFVELNGINNISPSSKLEILPYIITKAEYLQYSTGDPFNNGSKYVPGFGADFKLGLGSNLMLNATINPDFGQVEVDPAVVNLSDVETYFNEKRPFFTEGSNIFSFGYGGSNSFWGFNWANPSIFYSRRIGRVPQGSLPDNDYADLPVGTHILGAAKLTGKLGDSWNIGVINALTSREMAKIQYEGTTSKTEIEPVSYYSIYRAQRDFNNGKQGLGFLSTYTNRFFNDKRLKDEINRSAFIFGLDGWTFLDNEKEWVITGWSAGSHVKGNNERMINLQNNSLHYFQRPDADYVSIDSAATSLSGYAGRLTLNKQKGNVLVNSAFGIVSPGFDINDAGFMWRTDAINFHTGIGYKWTEPGKIIHRASTIGAVFRNYDFGGNITWEGFFHNASITFTNYYYFEYRFAYNPETVNNRRTRGGPLSLNHNGWETGFYARSDQKKPWTIDINFNTYQSADGTYNSLGFGIEWKPLSNISVSINPQYEKDITKAQWVDVFDDNNAAATFGKRYVFAELNQNTLSAGIRLNWTFTPELSLQLFMQPLISSGDYERFKELAKPKSYDYNFYGEENNSEIILNGNEYTVDPDGSGPAGKFVFSNPDFNFVSLRGNAVLRWEYNPGSIIYLVWTQSRSDDINNGRFNFKNSLDRMIDSRSDNIFMLKATYWFNM